jgi:hypothetical protein
MKKFTFFLLAALIVFLGACKKTPHDMIKGNWDIAKIENSSYTLPEDIDFFNKINAEVLEKEKYVIEDGKISKSMPEATVGSWKMDEEGTKLIIDWGKNDIYSPHNYVIKTLTDESLIIEEDFDEFSLITTFNKAK